MKFFSCKNIVVISVLIAIGLATRLLGHQPNFTAVGALALLSGSLFNIKRGYLVPLLTLFVSDIFIGFYSLPIMLSVYGSFVLIYFLGRGLKRQTSFSKLLFGSIIGGVLFYFLTNWAVWAFGALYPHTLSGLLASYYNALPFFRNTLLGNVFYAGVLSGAYRAAKRLNLEFNNKQSWAALVKSRG